DPRRGGDTARVALERAVLGHRRTGVADRRQHVECEHPLLERRALAPEVWPSRQQPLAARVLYPEAGRGDRELALRRQAAAMGDREERDPMEVHLGDPGVSLELQVEEKMAGFVRTKRH